MCPVLCSELDVIVYMILQECIIIYEMGDEISDCNYGYMHNYSHPEYRFGGR